MLFCLDYFCYDPLRLPHQAQYLMLLRFRALLLSFIHFPDNLLIIIYQLLVLLSAFARLISVRSSQSCGVVLGFLLFLLRALFDLLDSFRIGYVLTDGSLVFAVETLVGVLGGDFITVAGLGVAWVVSRRQG